MRIHSLLAPIILAASFCVQTASAQEKIIPGAWEAHLVDAISNMVSGIDDKMQETSAQRVLNELSSNRRVLKDAELVLVYLQLFERLKPVDRSALRAEQEAWLEKREKNIESSVQSRGGSLESLERTSAANELTDQRTADLKKRLSAIDQRRP